MSTIERWPEGREQLLKKLCADGLSARQIADEIGCGLTKNAVIGRAHRLGLSGRRPKAIAFAGATHNSKPRQPAVKRIARVARAAPRTMLAAIKIAEPGRLAVPDKRIPVEQRVTTVLSLTAVHCRWPVGDPGTPDFFFCGGPKVPSVVMADGRVVDCPYCAHHAARAYQPR